MFHEDIEVKEDAADEAELTDEATREISYQPTDGHCPTCGCATPPTKARHHRRPRRSRRSPRSTPSPRPGSGQGRRPRAPSRELPTEAGIAGLAIVTTAPAPAHRPNAGTSTRRRCAGESPQCPPRPDPVAMAGRFSPGHDLCQWPLSYPLLLFHRSCTPLLDERGVRRSRSVNCSRPD